MSPRVPFRRWLAASLIAVSLAAQSSAAAVGVVPNAVVPASVDSVAPAAVALTAGLASLARRPAVAVPSVHPSAARTVPKPATPKPTPKPAVAKPVAKPKPPSAATAFHGRNHVWIPALGINRSISFFPCSRSRPPDNYVYRWGCAGRNNVYLLGHAYSVFKPLHDAYVRGRLHKGMLVVYADGNGRVRSYRVSYWKVVSPVGADWAWAAQSRPSMTLQTCLGAQSQWRLIVRLVAV